MTEESYKNIRNKIFDYLSRQGFSEKKLLQKVTDLKKNYPRTKRYAEYTAHNVSRVLDDLRAEGYVNDYEYAQSVLRQLKDRKDGMRRIREKMHRRLIPREIIDRVFHEFEQAGSPQDFTKIVRDTQRKRDELNDKLGQSKRAQYTLQQKLYAFVAQRGYLPEEVKKILDKVLKKEFTCTDGDLPDD